MKQKFAGNEPQSNSRFIIELDPAESAPTENRFRKLLLEAVDESLSALGETPKQAVYFHLKENFNIHKKDIPDKIDDFTFAIEKIFGEGAKLLEIQIMRLLHEKTGKTIRHQSKKNSLSFPEYLQAHENI
jgi:hypothetical protein